MCAVIGCSHSKLGRFTAQDPVCQWPDPKFATVQMSKSQAKFTKKYIILKPSGAEETLK